MFRNFRRPLFSQNDGLVIYFECNHPVKRGWSVMDHWRGWSVRWNWRLAVSGNPNCWTAQSFKMRVKPALFLLQNCYKMKEPKPCCGNPLAIQPTFWFQWIVGKLPNLFRFSILNFHHFCGSHPLDRADFSRHLATAFYTPSKACSILQQNLQSSNLHCSRPLSWKSLKILKFSIFFQASTFFQVLRSHMFDHFCRMGFDDKGIVALSGAHTIGRAFKERSGTVKEGYGEILGHGHSDPVDLGNTSSICKFKCLCKQIGFRMFSWAGGPRKTFPEVV